MCINSRPRRQTVPRHGRQHGGHRSQERPRPELRQRVERGGHLHPRLDVRVVGGHHAKGVRQLGNGGRRRRRRSGRDPLGPRIATVLAFKIVDKDGGKGIDADWIVVMKCARKQGLKGVIFLRHVDQADLRQPLSGPLLRIGPSAR